MPKFTVTPACTGSDIVYAATCVFAVGVTVPPETTVTVADAVSLLFEDFVDSPSADGLLAKVAAATP